MFPTLILEFVESLIRLNIHFFNLFMYLDFLIFFFIQKNFQDEIEKKEKKVWISEKIICHGCKSPTEQIDNTTKQEYLWRHVLAVFLSLHNSCYTIEIL